MALSGVIKTQFDAGTLTIKDGTGTPLEVPVRFDNADLQLSGVNPDLRNVTAYQTRGTLSSLRKTDRAFPTVSFSCKVSDFTEATTGTAADMVLGNGAFSSRVSTSTAIGDVVTFDLVFNMEGTDYGDAADQDFTLEDVHLALDFAEGDPNTFTFNGTVYGAIGGDLAQAEG